MYVFIFNCNLNLNIERSYNIPDYEGAIYKTSLFPKLAIEWNNWVLFKSATQKKKKKK